MAAPNVEVRFTRGAVAAGGDGHLEVLTLSDRVTGETEQVTSSWLFVFIGASPRTDWLGPDIARDSHGFVLTGQDLLASDQANRWPLGTTPVRSGKPVCRESSRPATSGSNSMKRVASAVGEGAMSIYLVHRYLGTI